MSKDTGPKSSFELAMERLRKKDAEEGIVASPLTDEQKKAIAEVRSLYDSKIAEQNILQQSAMKNPMAAAGIEDVAEPFRRERDRLASEREARVEKIRRGEA